MRVLGINAIFHDPSAALVIDGHTIAAAEEERFSRRKHGKRPVPFAAWELPELAMRWCLEKAGMTVADIDAVGYSFDPALSKPAEELGIADAWDHLRVMYAERAPYFLAASLPSLDPEKVHFVPHHVAHAASAALASPHRDSSVLVLDGRGERASHLAGRYTGSRLELLAGQELPHSLGLLYESLTEYLGFMRSSDEYKVMALASYGDPRYLAELRELVYATGDGGFVAEIPDWDRWAPRRTGEDWTSDHADLAASVQERLEEVLVDLARWLHAQTGDRVLTMAGGTALNCVANSRIWRETPFEEVWVQPAAGDAGTSLGAALQIGADVGVPPNPMTSAALGLSWTDDELAGWLRRAAVPFTAWWRGSMGGVSTARERSANDPYSPTRRTSTTRSGSTRSKGASSSGHSRRWCSPTEPPRSSPVVLCRAHTCCSCTTCTPTGRTGSPRSYTSTARLGSKPSMIGRFGGWPPCFARSKPVPACRCCSTRA
jgi:carbamoyltransferase